MHKAKRSRLRQLSACRATFHIGRAIFHIGKQGSWVTALEIRAVDVASCTNSNKWVEKGAIASKTFQTKCLP